MSRAGLDILFKTNGVNVNPSLLSLVRRHIAPLPRVSAGLALSACRQVHAAIDVSDGISREAHLLSYENNLQIDIEPVNGFKTKALACAAAFLKKDNWENWFFNGGEDYELLFAAHPDFDPVPICRKAGVICRKLGCFSKKGYGVYHKNNVLERQILKCAGWDHVKNG